MEKHRIQETTEILKEVMNEMDLVKEVEDWVRSKAKEPGNKPMPIDLANHITSLVDSSIAKIDIAIEKIKQLYPEKF